MPTWSASRRPMGRARTLARGRLSAIATRITKSAARAIGRYVLHYEHGVQETIPVIWGEDVRNWRSAEGGKPLKRGKVIWTGSNPMFRGSQKTANLYLTVWENPHPEKRVITLDYVGTTPVAPFCVAITAEEPVSGETRPTRK
ncbi:MAG: hypothetical protein MUE50_22805 [Pirellulaceae bacterium]|nr:hypothetical protein [Pirellulaceae bacterium]